MNILQRVSELNLARHRATHFRATVTGTSGDLVLIQRDGQASADTQAYVRDAACVVAVGDIVWVVDLNGNGGYLVSGKILSGVTAGIYANPTILGGYQPIVRPAVYSPHRVTGIVANTDTVLYIVPDATKAVVGAASIRNAAGAGAATAYLWIQFAGAGTRYRITNNVVLAANTNIVTLDIPATLVVGPTDRIGINTTAVSGGASVSVDEFTINLNSAEPLKTVWAKDPVIGTTTLYTVPALTKATIFGATGLPGATSPAGAVFLVNGTAGALNAYLLLTGVAIEAAAAVGATTVAARTTLGAGDSVLAAAETIGVNWSAADALGICAVTVVEEVA